VEIADALTGADLAFKEVVVTANGRTVFRAEGGPSLLRLAALDSRLDELEPLVLKLERVRARARDRFLAEAEAASAALQRVADILWWNAHYHTAVDGAFMLIDIGEAWAKGGPLAALAEAINKGLQALYFDVMLPPKPGFEAGTVESLIDAQFNASLKNPTSVKSMARAAYDRGIKDMAFKRLRDGAINKHVMKWVFETYEKPAQLGTAIGVLSRAKTGAELTKAYRSLIRIEGALAKHHAKLKEGFSYKFKDLAKGVVKDVAKTALKAELTAYEHAAWMRYIGPELQARLLFPYYQAASAKYWEAYDSYHAVLVEKTQLLDGFDAGAMRTAASEPFDDDAAVRVRVTLARPAPSVTFTVTLGGRATTRVGEDYVPADRDFEQTPSGAIELAFR
jgi:hypothetical protein